MQTPGCIQSYGVLLVLRQSDLTILQVSENSREWLGMAPDDLLTKQASLAVGESVAQIIRHVLDQERVEKSSLYLTTLKAGQQKNSRDLHVSLHTHSGVVLLELENASTSDPEPPDQLRVDPDYYGLVRRTLTRFQATTSIKALSQSITDEVRRITGLDRVMVYRFHPDDSGEVIAESKRDDQAAWLGFRYPAHDIPRPAREIFQKIWSRPVPDVRAGLFEMVPLLNPDTGNPLDMTYCSLRGASIMYTEYLDNMGVRAALTLSLRRGNELWGLVACHHDTPKVISYRVRAACEFLACSASQQLLWAEAAENAEYRIAMEAANYELIAKLTPASDFSDFTAGPDHLGCKMNCGGAAIFFQEKWHQVGETPSIPEMAELGRWLMTQPACQLDALDPIFQTDHLAELYPAAKSFATVASGVLGFCFSRSPLGLVLYFRPETLRMLTWAGNPYELPVATGPYGPRLSPRKSFELWRETVNERSLPWKTIEIESVLKLRVLVSDIAERKQREDELRADLKDRLRVNQALAAANKELAFQIEEKGKRANELAAIVEERTVANKELVFQVEEKGKRADELAVLVEERMVANKELAFQIEEKGKRADELAVINTELTRSKDALERSNVELGQFAYVASHDLQTPLRNINGFVQLLKANYQGKLDAKADGWMKRIVESSVQMHSLIQDVLTYSRVDSRARPFELVSLQDVYNDSVLLLQASIEDASGEVSCGELPAVMGDRSQLVQLFQNLIGNGLKYHGEKPPLIQVSAERAGRNWMVAIHDNGIGIATRHQEQIFDIFKRLHNQQEYPGTGIGLAVCRRVVQRHGGKIWAESEGEGCGSTFSFTIPEREADQL